MAKNLAIMNARLWGRGLVGSAIIFDLREILPFSGDKSWHCQKRREDRRRERWFLDLARVNGCRGAEAEVAASKGGRRMLRTGEVAVLGANGSVKSTLRQLLTGGPQSQVRERTAPGFSKRFGAFAKSATLRHPIMNRSNASQRGFGSCHPTPGAMA